MIIDIVKERQNFTQLFQIQVCSGLFNRPESNSLTSFVIMDGDDIPWLQELYNISGANMNVSTYLTECYKHAKSYVLYDIDTQQELLPNILTLCTMLDAIPVDIKMHRPD